jgi:hypothetical protein
MGKRAFRDGAAGVNSVRALSVTIGIDYFRNSDIPTSTTIAAATFHKPCILQAKPFWEDRMVDVAEGCGWRTQSFAHPDAAPPLCRYRIFAEYHLTLRCAGLRRNDARR